MAFRGTTVTFLRTEDGSLFGYEAQGHAMFAPSGRDIVCAAVSALTQTTLLGLENVLKAPLSYRIGEGLIEVRLAPEIDLDMRARAQILLSTLYEGVRSIEDSYPSNVRVVLKDWRSKKCSR